MRSVAKATLESDKATLEDDKVCHEDDLNQALGALPAMEAHVQAVTNQCQWQIQVQGCI